MPWRLNAIVSERGRPTMMYKHVNNWHILRGICHKWVKRHAAGVPNCMAEFRRGYYGCSRTLSRDSELIGELDGRLLHKYSTAFHSRLVVIIAWLFTFTIFEAAPT